MVFNMTYPMMKCNPAFQVAEVKFPKYVPATARVIFVVTLCQMYLGQRIVICNVSDDVLLDGVFFMVH